MKVAIIYSPAQQKLDAAAHLLGQALIGAGHLVDYVHIAKIDRPVNLNRYDFLYVGSVAESVFSGNISVEVAAFLKECRGLQNIKTAAFVAKRGLFFNGRALQRLMAVMESEGAFVSDFQIISARLDADALVQRLKIT